MARHRPQVNRTQELRNRGISYRVTQTEYDEIKKYADARGLTMGMFFDLVLSKFWDKEGKRK